MEDALPSEVDVVVVGTGLPESMLAAACSRSGLSVLHLDDLSHYGALWASFNLKTFDEWAAAEDEKKTSDKDAYRSLVTEGEEISWFESRKLYKMLSDNWTEDKVEQIEKVKNEWRRFSIDISPKILLARGPMVQTLCDSEVCKYAEFKMVDRILGLKDGILHAVPCSRGEIFETDLLSMIDKRRLIKFLQFCVEWEKDKESSEIAMWKEFAEKPFAEFLASQGIVGVLGRYIERAIGIVEDGRSTREGLSSVCRFVDSIGRFGPSPFLFPLFGSGELPQCFSRLCAVYGGVYCLGRNVDGIVEKDGRVVAVLASGQRVNCSHVVINSSFLPTKYTRQNEKDKTFRAILITEGSILKGDKEHISLANLADLDENVGGRLLEVGAEGCAAPKGYYLCHITCPRNGSSVVDGVIDKLYSREGSSVLRRIEFEVDSVSPVGVPSNMGVLFPPDNALHYSHTIQQSRDQFASFWPDRDFLPQKLAQEEDVENDDTEYKEEESTAETQQDQ